MEKIFITPRGGAKMQAVEQVEAVANQGLSGDRYMMRTGYWSGIDECEVTLIEAEDLEEIKEKTGLQVEQGEHRRNIVTCGIRLEELGEKRFRVGEAVLEYDRPRPPCSYIQSLTERGMTKALYGRGGICARVVRSGVIRVGDEIGILEEAEEEKVFRRRMA